MNKSKINIDRLLHSIQSLGKQKILFHTRNLFDKSILWMAAITLCDKSRLQRVNAAKLVNDITGIFVNALCDKSKLKAQIA